MQIPKHHRRALANGIEITAIPMPWAHTAVVQAHIRVGSRYETERLNGISHFLEHMMYRGTETLPSAHAVVAAIEELGASLDAATAADHGAMTVSVPPENLHRVIPIFGEVFAGPILADLEVERGIVREEILEDLDEDGNQVAPDNLLRELCFGTHPLGFPVTGTLDHLERFDRATLLQHHAAHYTGMNTVLTVAGPIAVQEVFDSLEQNFGGLQRGEVQKTHPAQPIRGPRWRSVRHHSSQTLLQIAFDAPSVHDVAEPAIELLMRVLDDGMSTRLYHRICDVLGLCYDVAASYEAFSDVGVIELAAETSHEQAPKVLTELLGVARSLKEAGPTAREFELAKARVRWQHQEMFDDLEEVTEFYGLGQLTGVALTPERRVEQLMAVSLDEVRSAAERVFVPAGLCGVAVGMPTKRVRHALEALVLGFE